ncbi:hypothetical protein G7Z17_g12902 [Cylindrodendrum hubeiense]|uniref:Xylanolytic transcriptional activator regulatory domain-containing protein n=1 Tax=Cylindrodendrum hubeiense TaxID=595255 RepID=A0A9P5H112_9HYPO|nr:hypothetical protein G7Z17_g12902 [Cylindrodendrum hubeiense]
MSGPPVSGAEIADEATTVHIETTPSGEENFGAMHPTQESLSSASGNMLNGQGIADRAAHALNQLIRTDIHGLNNLVQAWLDEKVNLPLAEPFVARCAEATKDLATLLPPSAAGLRDPSPSVVQQAKIMLRNTLRRVNIQRESTVEDYFSQMFGDNLRWETIGIFFSAASRAAIDIESFPSLYMNEQQRSDLIRALTYVGDCCLETCLALDCLNDLQLVLQYENFIVHSQVDGDQSYHSWRRMGDLASSLFALGYHEKIDTATSNIPPFVAELRKAAFARIYTGDKSLAVFLGRPPRIAKAYCTFQLPANEPGIWDNTDSTIADSETSLGLPDREGSSAIDSASNSLEPINYTAETRWKKQMQYEKQPTINGENYQPTSNSLPASEIAMLIHSPKISSWAPDLTIYTPFSSCTWLL